MKRLLQRSVLYLFILVFPPLLIAGRSFSQSAGDYRSVTTGNSLNWSSLSAWQRFDGVAWVTPAAVSPQGYPGQYPGTGNVLIRNSSTATVYLDVSPAYPVASLMIGVAGTNSAAMSNGPGDLMLTVTGNVTVADGSFNLVNAQGGNDYTLAIGGNLDVATGSTLNFNGPANDKGTLLFNGTNHTINGPGSIQTESISFSNAGWVNINSNINVASTMTVGPNAVINPAATTQFNNAAAAGTITGTGTLNVTRLSAPADYSTQYRFSTHSIAALKVDYNGMGAQTVNGYTYGSLSTGGSGTKTMGAGATVNAGLTVGPGSVLDQAAVTTTLAAAAILTVNGTLNFSNTAGMIRTAASGSVTLQMGSAGTIKTLDENGLGPVAGASLQVQGAGSWITTSASTAGTIEYERNNTNGQAITDRDYNNLVITGTSQLKTWSASATRTINGNLTIGGNLSIAGSSTINVRGNWIRTGGTFTPNTGTINFNGTGAQLIAGTATTHPFFNLAIKKSSGSVTMSGGAASLSVSNTLNVVSGLFNAGTADITAVNFVSGSAGIIDLATRLLTATTVNHGGLLQTQNSSATAITSYKTWGGTVEYYGITQTIVPGTYDNLLISSIGTKTAGGTLDVNFLDNGGSADMGAVLDMTGHALTAGTVDNTGATIRFNGTANGVAVSTGTVDYYGAGQIVAMGTYATLIMSGGGTNFAEGPITVTSLLDNGGPANTPSQLNMALETLTVSAIDNSNATVRFSGAGLAIASGTVIYEGAGQTVAAGVYRDMQVRQSAGNAALAGNVTVTNNLELSSGNIVTGAYILSITNTASTAIVRTSGHVVGNLQRAIATGANIYDYPVGNTANYLPASFSFTAVSGGGSMAIKTADGAGLNYPAALNAGRRMTRNWVVINNGVTGYNLTASFSFLASDLAGGATTAQLKAYRADPGPVVTYLPAANYNVSGNTISFNNISSLGGVATEFGAGTCKTGFIPSFSKTMASSCGGGSDGTITVTPAGGTAPYSFSWTGAGGFTSTNAAINGLPSGDYTVVITEVTGCTASIPDITIWQAQTPVVTNNGGNSGSCNASGYIILYGSYGIAPFTYSIDGVNYSASNTFNNVAAGTYTGYVKDLRGCIGTKPNIVISKAPALAITASAKASSSCSNNGSIELYRSGGMGPYTFSLNNIVYQAGFAFNNLAPGTYTGWIKDAKGCKASIPGIVVTQITPVIVSAGKTNSSACTNDGTIQLKAAGGVPGYTYSLNDIIYQPGSSFFGLGAGTYTGWVKDAKGCKSSVQVTLSVSPLAVTAYAAGATACSNNGSIQLFRTGGTGPYTYSLDNITYQPGNVFTGLAGGTYTGWVKDSKGCKASLGGIVVVQSGPVTAAAGKTNSSSCINDGTIQVRPGGGVAGYTYSLDNINYQVNPSFTGLGPGNYTGWVKDSRGCKASVNVSIGLNPVLVTAYAANAGNCSTANGSIQLFRTGGTGPYTYSLDGNNYQSSNSFTGLMPGTYTGYVKDAKSCIGSMPNIFVGPGCAPTVVNPGNRVISGADPKVGSTASGSSSLKINAYPNPSTAGFTLEMNGLTNEKVQVTLRDIMGNKLEQVNNSRNRFYTFGDRLRPGTYFIEVSQGSEKLTCRLTKL